MWGTHDFSFLNNGFRSTSGIYAGLQTKKEENEQWFELVGCLLLPPPDEYEEHKAVGC